MRTNHLLTSLTSLVALSITALSIAALSIAAPAPGHELTIPAGADLGKVKVCNGLRSQSTCHAITAHMACTQLQPPVRYNLRSLVQAKGNICVYHQGPRCENPIFIVDSIASAQSADAAPKWSPVLTSVLCAPGSADAASASASASHGVEAAFHVLP
ncbi:uncharacterized protein M421DRAFT_90937 [Didymella exigua CBS 183.55]|uniref:Uncharacterized protein n=1 Tax=Didymella exigua CBS 183.55 TaxID=1150837 RepID=A0A6A5RPP0_9PLEO|nr:uncharacterized protein M421DRAFT_90937 [Didymella exigua CBS 183.55]KAF1930391.1 hypothetical protein M421DRAFT_90937 [Didymella exigua CBS 183.55]